MISLFPFILIYCQLHFPCSEAVIYDIKASSPHPPWIHLSTVFSYRCCHFNNQFLLLDFENIWSKNPAPETHSEMQWFLLEKATLQLWLYENGKGGRCYTVCPVSLLAWSKADKIITFSLALTCWVTILTAFHLFLVEPCLLVPFAGLSPFYQVNCLCWSGLTIHHPNRIIVAEHKALITSPALEGRKVWIGSWKIHFFGHGKDGLSNHKHREALGARWY